MKIQSFQPIDPTLKSLVESYLWMESDRDMEAMTVPNGRVDASIALQGELYWFFPACQEFKLLPACTLYPPTRTGGRVRTRYNFCCFGVKFYPHLLALAMFENQKLCEPLGFHEFFNTLHEDATLVEELKKAKNLSEQAALLDAYFKKRLFPAETTSGWIHQVVNAIESGSSASLKMQQVADSMGVSIKTLERRFVKAIGLTPKLFSTVIQLQQTVHTIRKTSPDFSHGDLGEALGNGYYDQSHFIKSCQRITGLTPKKLFTRLPGTMTDLIILN